MILDDNDKLLRDMFAAHALTAILAPNSEGTFNLDRIADQEWVAKHAYAMADAMMAERDKEAAPSFEPDSEERG